MHVRLIHSAMLFAALTFPSAAQEGEHPRHWGYSGEVGPEHWAEFESEFGACTNGKNQSPIDLRNFIEAELPKLAFDYQPGGYQVVNNGHAVQVDYSPGSSVTVDDTQFALKQFHFHSPSENTIAGKSFPMEAHFVHVDANGNLAVVALMFEQGPSNQLLEQVWPHVPKVEDGESLLATPVSAADLLPANRDYYRYEGSLTTPPCSEGVRWLVLKQPSKASSDQLSLVGQTIGHPNNRPVQKAGARMIVQ